MAGQKRNLINVKVVDLWDLSEEVLMVIVLIALIVVKDFNKLMFPQGMKIHFFNHKNNVGKCTGKGFKIEFFGRLSLTILFQKEYWYLYDL